MADYRWLLRILLVLVLVLVPVLGLSGCGGEDATEPTIPASGEIRVTVPPEGATYVLTTDEGVRVTLAFPAGAVETPQAIVVTAGVPSGDSWVNLQFAPEGLILRKPVQVTLAAPEGMSAEDQILHWGSGSDAFILPTTVDVAARTLVTSIRTFGIPGVVIVVPGPGEPAPGGTAPAPDGVLGSAQGSGGSNNMNSQVQSCAQTVAQAQAAFDAFKAGGAYEDAVRSALASAEILQLSACPDEANAFIETASELGCQVQADLMQEAIDAIITDHGQFEAQVTPVLQWMAQMQNLDPLCPAVLQMESFIEGQVDDFLAFYRTRLGTLQALDWNTFQDLKMELAHIWHTWALGQTLGVEPADDIRARGLFATYDELREVAYGMARDHGWRYPLSRLTATGCLAGRDIIGITPPRLCDDYFSPPRCPNVPQVARFTDQEIFEDLQYAGVDLELQGRRFDGVLGTLRFTGQSPGQFDAPTENLPVFTRGEIRLQGKLPAFTCWDGVLADTQIGVFVNGIEIHALDRSGSLPDYVDPYYGQVDAYDVVKTIGTIQGGSLSTLELKRRRTACDERLWGPAEFTLLTAQIEWKAPEVDA